MTGFKSIPLHEAEEEMKKLPEAKLVNCLAAEKDDLASDMVDYPSRRVILVNGRPEAVVSSSYKLVQHATAFSPVLEGLALSTEPVTVSFDYRGPHAYLKAMVEKEVTDTVRLGFEVQNSHDGKHAIKYGFSTEQVHKYKENVKHEREMQGDEDIQHGGYRFIEVMGYRQTCSNGMRIRVPVSQEQIDKAPALGVGSIIDIAPVLKEIWSSDEERETILTHCRTFNSVRHMGDPEKLVKKQKDAVAIVLQLHNPVSKLITRAQDRDLAPGEWREVLEAMFGSGLALNINHFAIQNGDPMASAWDLYNAMTWFASHKCENDELEKTKIENRAADYLVLLAPQYYRS